MVKNSLILIIVLLTSSKVSAADEQAKELTQDQRELFDSIVAEAIEAYSSRHYERAIELFEQAYALQPEPELLYNIARSHERLLQREAAVEWYQRFLETPGTTGELRVRALTNLTALRQEIVALEAARRAEQSAMNPTPEEEKVVPASQEPERNIEQRREDTGQTEEETDHPIGPLSIAGWSLVGTGGAALIAGSVFGGMALANHSDYDNAGYDVDRVGYREDMERNALVFDIVFFSGLGLAAVGATLLVIDLFQGHSNEARGDGKVGLVPSLVTDGGSTLGFATTLHF